MKASELFIPTLREVPAEAELASHKLLLRGGFIRKIAAGVYSFLPLGWRVLQKVEAIVREEMNAQGGQEILMPAMVPSELLEETGRWETMQDILFKFKDRSAHDYCLGPTHEEVVTDLVRHEVRSYRQLPILLYQIQTKFRDEPRARGGLIRCREFVMKDLYSFDKDRAGLDLSYDKMFKAYCNIFDRCGLNYKIVEAEAGSIGGTDTKEFHVPVSSGEDVLIYCEDCDYAANMETAEVGGVPARMQQCEAPMEKVETPNAKTIEDVASFLKVETSELVKTLILVADGKPIAALIRGDRDLNIAKLQRALHVSSLEMADAETVQKVTNAPVGFAGPVGLVGAHIIADPEVATMTCCITGGNETDTHFKHVVPERDFLMDEIADIRNAVAGDLCPHCGGILHAERGIEIGHIFKLGTKYTEDMKATFLDEEGAEKPIIMGCYGIGISRVVASVVENCHDDNGIKWPASIAPFQALVILMNPTDDVQMGVATPLYEELQKAGIDTLLDDRNERPGVKFKDADLIGIPVQIVVGRLAKEGKVELRVRGVDEKLELSASEALAKVQELLEAITPKPHLEK